MKVLMRLLVPFMFLVLVGCSSPYNYINMPYPVNEPVKVEQAEAMGQLYKLAVTHMEKGKFIYSMTGLSEFSRYYNDNVKSSDIGSKYKVKKVEVNDKFITLSSSNENSMDGQIKTVLFRIDKTQKAQLCKVKRVHKETQEVSYLYRLFLNFYAGYIDADGKEMIVDFYTGLNLESKEDMDAIVNLLNSIYTPQFICQ